MSMEQQSLCLQCHRPSPFFFFFFFFFPTRFCSRFDVLTCVCKFEAGAKRQKELREEKIHSQSLARHNKL